MWYNAREKRKGKRHECEDYAIVDSSFTACCGGCLELYCVWQHCSVASSFCGVSGVSRCNP